MRKTLMAVMLAAPLMALSLVASAAAGYNRYGNVPVSATQYDYLGVSLFARLNYKF